MINLSIRNLDGSRHFRPVEYASLAEACRYALDLAHQLGCEPADGVAPRWVDVVQDGKLEIAVAIISDGLLSPGKGDN
jgi:hypothetical protein